MKIPREVTCKNVINAPQKIKKVQPIPRTARPILATYDLPMKNIWYEKQKAISSYMKNKELGEFSISYNQGPYGSLNSSSYNITKTSLDRYFRPGKSRLKDIGPLIQSEQSKLSNFKEFPRDQAHYKIYTRISHNLLWGHIMFRRVHNKKKYINTMLVSIKATLKGKIKSADRYHIAPNQGAFVHSKLLSYFKSFKEFLGLDTAMTDGTKIEALKISQRLIKDQLLTNTTEIKHGRMNSKFSVEDFYLKLQDNFGTNVISEIQKLMTSNKFGREQIKKVLTETLTSNAILTSDEITILMLCWLQDGADLPCILSQLGKYNDQLDLNASHYNILLHRDSGNMLECLEQMWKLHIKPDRITMSTLIETAGKTNDIELLLKVTYIMLHIIQVDIDLAMVERITKAYIQCGQKMIPLLFLKSAINSYRTKPTSERCNEPDIDIDDVLAVDALLINWEYEGTCKPLLNHAIKPTEGMLMGILNLFKGTEHNNIIRLLASDD